MLPANFMLNCLHAIRRSRLNSTADIADTIQVNIAFSIILMYTLSYILFCSVLLCMKENCLQFLEKQTLAHSLHTNSHRTQIAMSIH